MEMADLDYMPYDGFRLRCRECHNLTYASRQQRHLVAYEGSERPFRRCLKALHYAEGVTHDYVRHGTTTLFAALDIASGQVIHSCKARHRHQEFLQFLREIERNVPPNLDVHLVVDNYGAHKQAKVRHWLALRPRWHVHYTPTYASWLNQVEIWFNIITQKAIRRGSFKSVKELIARIERFVRSYNGKCKAFVWVATADSILSEVKRLCQRISGTEH